MKDAIDFLTQIVEKDDTRASFSKKLTHDPENSHQNNKENHLQKQTTRKPSIYSSRNSTASLLKNVLFYLIKYLFKNL